MRRFDAEAQAPYLWDPGRRLFVAYDDPDSVARKAAYVRERGLRGMMFWKLGDDGGALLAAIHCGLARSPSVPECVASRRERR